MQCEPRVELDWHPNRKIGGGYRRLLFTRRSGLAAATRLPGLACRATDVPLDADHVVSYQRVCGLPLSDNLPLLYPHALLGSAHLTILGAPQFPLHTIGLLHLRNHCIQYRPIQVDETPDLDCQLTRQRWTERGLEFDLDATASCGGQVVWRSISTYLKRGKAAGELEESPLSDLFSPLEAAAAPSNSIHVASDIGRQYARVSGDYNPIHVSTLAAKLFGFPRAIAHGMWSVARVVPELPSLPGPVRLDVAFKGPVLVGSEIAVHVDDARFDVFCGDNPRPVIVGNYCPASDGELLL